MICLFGENEVGSCRRGHLDNSYVLGVEWNVVRMRNEDARLQETHVCLRCLFRVTGIASSRGASFQKCSLPLDTSSHRNCAINCIASDLHFYPLKQSPPS